MYCRDVRSLINGGATCGNAGGIEPRVGGILNLERRGKWGLVKQVRNGAGSLPTTVHRSSRVNVLPHLMFCDRVLMNLLIVTAMPHRLSHY